MSNIYRLSANVFDRRDPYKNPRRVIWLSVEGKRTEINYFEHLNKYKNKLDIDITIQSMRIFVPSIKSEMLKI